MTRRRALGLGAALLVVLIAVGAGIVLTRGATRQQGRQEGKPPVVQLLTPVHGTLDLVGGAIGTAGTARPESHVVIRFLKDGQVVRRVTTNAKGRFVVYLPAGTFGVTVGSNPAIRRHVLRVRLGHTPLLRLTIEAM